MKRIFCFLSGFLMFSYWTPALTYGITNENLRVPDISHLETVAPILRAFYAVSVKDSEKDYFKRLYASEHNKEIPTYSVRDEQIKFDRLENALYFSRLKDGVLQLKYGKRVKRVHQSDSPFQFVTSLSDLLKPDKSSTAAMELFLPRANASVASDLALPIAASAIIITFCACVLPPRGAPPVTWMCAAVPIAFFGMLGAVAFGLSAIDFPSKIECSPKKSTQGRQIQFEYANGQKRSLKFDKSSNFSVANSVNDHGEKINFPAKTDAVVAELDNICQGELPDISLENTNAFLKAANDLDKHPGTALLPETAQPVSAVK